MDFAFDLLDISTSLGTKPSDSSQVSAAAEVAIRVRYGQFQASGSYDVIADKVKGTLTVRPFCRPGLAVARRVRFGAGTGGTVYDGDKK